MKIGGRVMVEAVSGQEVVEQRANLIRELTRLCKVVIRSGEDLVYTGNTEGFAPDIRDALETVRRRVGLEGRDRHAPAQARDRTPSKEKVAVRLPGRRADRRRDGPDRHARPDRGRRRGTPRRRSGTPQEHDKIFLLPVLKVMGSPWRFFRGRTLAKIVGGPAGDRRPDPDPDVRPLEADDRGPGLAPARGAADHLRPGRRDRRRGPGRARPARQEGRPARQAREPRAGEGAEAADRRDAGGRRRRRATSTIQVSKATTRGTDEEQPAPGPAPRGQDQGQERRRSRSRSSRSRSSR